MIETGEFIERNCPCCDSKNSKIEVSSEKKAEETSFEVLKNSWLGFSFKEPLFFSYFRCADCGVLFNKKFFSSKKLAELYASMPDNTGGQGLGNISKTQRSYFNFLKKQNFAKGDYLELGPDIGLFSRNVINHGGFEKYYFIEPNRAVHPQLKKVLGNKTAFISTDIFNLESIPNNSLSLVVLIHVLDHLIQPKEMIEAINQKMVKGGIILIVTHDEKSLLTKILKKKWPPFCLQHPQLFNVKTIKKLLSNCGFGQHPNRR